MSLEYPTRYDPKRFGNTYLQFFAPHDVWHCGTDFNWGFGSEDRGQPVVSPTWGVVEYVSPLGFNGGLGNYIVINHPHNDAWTRYLHLERIDVVIGQKVAPKQTIGLLGGTGTTSPHLHFEVLNFEGLEYIKQWFRPYGRYPEGMSKQDVQKRWLDPIKWLNEQNHYVGVPVDKRIEQAKNAMRWATDLRRNMLLRLIDRLTKLL